MKKLKEVRDRVALYIRNNPQRSFADIAHDLGISISTVSRVAREYHLSRDYNLKINLPKEANN